MRMKKGIENKRDRKQRMRDREKDAKPTDLFFVIGQQLNK